MTTSFKPHGTDDIELLEIQGGVQSAKPCQLTQPLTPIPIEASFRKGAGAFDENPGPTLFATPGDSELVKGGQKCPFDLAEKSDDVLLSSRFQVDDGIPDQLPAPVISDVTPSGDAMDFDAPRYEFGFAHPKVLGLRVATERDRGRVLQQEQSIAGATGTPVLERLLLKRESLSVGNGAQPIDAKRHRDSLGEGFGGCSFAGEGLVAILGFIRQREAKSAALAFP